MQDNNQTENDNFISAICEINLERVRELIDIYGADVNCVLDSRSRSPLHHAVLKRSKEIVTLLLSRGANVDVKGMESETPLHLAAWNGCISIAEDLLNHGACIYSLTLTKGYTPLHLASIAGKEETVNFCLDRGVDINHATKDNLTPLHIATKARSETVVKLLLRRGAKVDNQDKDGKTVLQVAVEAGHSMIVEDILKYRPDISNRSNKSCLTRAVQEYSGEYKNIVCALLEYGFNVNPEDANNPQLLHHAVRNRYLKIVEDLLKYGADVNTLLPNSIGYDNDTPLHNAVINKQEEIAKLLISHGADVNAKNYYQKAPIFYAIQNADLNIFKLLLTNGANIKNNPELLKIAVEKECIEIVEALLKHDVDINASDAYGRTALHFTVFKEYDYNNIRFPDFEKRIFPKEDSDIKGEIAKLLLSKGANVDAQTKKGETTLYIATQYKYEKVVEALLEYNASVNCEVKSYESPFSPLHIWANEGNEKIVTMLLNNGADVNAKFWYKGNYKIEESALHVAIERCFEGIVKVLLEYGANIDSLNGGYGLGFGTTPLLLSAEKGNIEIFTMLLNKGANVNATQEFGITALHLASENGHKGIVKLLLECDVKVDPICAITPLFLAAKIKNKEVITMLLNKGANINAENIERYTALHVSAERGLIENVRVLLEWGAKVDAKADGDITPLHLAVCHENVLTTLLEYGADININSTDNNTFLDFAMNKLDRFYVDKSIKVLLRHLVKMKFANLYVSEQNLQSMTRFLKYECEKVIGRNYFQYQFAEVIARNCFQYQCEQEMARMMNEKIKNANISFYDILTASSASLEIYMRNKNILKVLKSDNYKKKFPIYDSTIESQLRRGMERKELLEQGSKVFHFLFNKFPELPHDCIEKIYSYLSDKDLRMLVVACKPQVL